MDALAPLAPLAALPMMAGAERVCRRLGKTSAALGLVSALLVILLTRIAVGRLFGPEGTPIVASAPGPLWMIAR